MKFNWRVSENPLKSVPTNRKRKLNQTSVDKVGSRPKSPFPQTM